VSRDWHEWHRAYDVEGSPLAARLAIVQGVIARALQTAPPGPIGAVSMCAGEARDLSGALVGHPRRGDVRGRVVELDPVLAEIAREALPAAIEVLVGDAGAAASYDGAVPADLVLVCGVFGNIVDADMENTIRMLPTLCAPGATVVWTRHRRPPDLTVSVRSWLSETGFEEIEFIAPEGFLFGIGVARFIGDPQPFRTEARLFQFVGYDTIAESCPSCGFVYAHGRAEILAWLRADIGSFVARFSEIDAARVRVRPQPDVWSPLEYACHVRDVLRVMSGRVEQAQREFEPAFTPMRRDERVIEDRYNEQDPAVVAKEITAAGEEFIATLERLNDDGWARRGLYNYPEPALRNIDWIAANTVHELYHHRHDLTA
jgi:hypothetical protein